jgi:hypothetical protein
MKRCLYRHWWSTRSEPCVSNQHAGKSRAQRFMEMWGEPIEEYHGRLRDSASRREGE